MKRQFTVITNSSEQVLYIELDNMRSSRLVAELITGNPNVTRIKHTHTASPEFKERINLLDVLGEKAYEAKQFFCQIPNGKKFLFLPGRIEDKLLILAYSKELAKAEGVPYEDPTWERIAPYLFDHYEVRTFSGDERLKVGINDKTKRVCRFCGKTVPDTTFKQKSHAISESLGNKGLICREECDKCNRRFNETIEQDVVHFFQFNLLFKGVKGKHGCPVLKGNDISFSLNHSSRTSLSRGTIVIKTKDMPDTNDPQEIAQFLSRKFSFPSINFVPQNVYKCFCKYVLSLIDSKHLSYFKDTISWINEPLVKRHLPPVWHYNIPLSTTPSLTIMLRKHNHKEIPYCWAILNVASSQYLFIIPFCALDKYKFVDKTRLAYFINGLKNIMPNINLHPLQMNGISPVKQKLDFHLDIPSGCIEGKDYYFIDSHTDLPI